MKPEITASEIVSSDLGKKINDFQESSSSKFFLTTDRLYSKFCIRQTCKAICKVIKQEVKNSMSYPKEMHKATCADCGKECDVPFKPDGTRPVYCRECYSKRRPPRRY
jgi:CxxC-x17-CxxC domain-containing protein